MSLFITKHSINISTLYPLKHQNNYPVPNTPITSPTIITTVPHHHLEMIAGNSVLYSNHAHSASKYKSVEFYGILLCCI